MTNVIKDITFSGGGICGIAFGGATIALEEEGVLSQLEGVCGTSVGSIAAILVSVGYKGKEIRDILSSTSFGNFEDSPWGVLGATYRLFYYFGIYEGTTLEDWLGKLIKEKTGSSETSFLDIYKIFGIELVILSTSLTKGQEVHFNYINHPDLPIKKAARMSMSYPIFFKPVIFNGEVMVDGGCLNNYAINYFVDRNPNRPTYSSIGFNLINEYEKPTKQIFYGTNPTGTLTDYCNSLINVLLIQVQRGHVKDKYWKRTAAINTGDVDSMNFDITEEQKFFLIDSGYNTTKALLQKIKNESNFKINLETSINQSIHPLPSIYTEQFGDLTNINVPNSVYNLAEIIPSISDIKEELSEHFNNSNTESESSESSSEGSSESSSEGSSEGSSDDLVPSRPISAESLSHFGSIKDKISSHIRLPSPFRRRK